MEIVQWYAVLLVAGLAVPVTPVRVVFLNAAGAQANVFNEGDTAVVRCRADYTDAPFPSALLEWQPYGSTDRMTIAEGEQILEQPGGRNRFSGANLTDIGDNTSDYRVTIDGVGRYDNGFSFYCQFIKESGESTGPGGVATKLVVNWQPPSVQCLDIAEKVKKNQDVSYSCSITDADAKSNGSLSLWKNDEQQGAATAAGSPADPVGAQYSVSYTIQITEEAAKDKYMCRYRGIGGFEEYNSNCTFQGPRCVVQDLADPCPNGVVPVHHRSQLMATLGMVPVLVMFWTI